MLVRRSRTRFAAVVSCVFFLFLFASFTHAEDKVIRVLYVNDFHGFAEPHQPLGSKEPLGGIAALAGKAEELRREKPSLLLAAGDMIQGETWANLFEGKSVIEVMNVMGFDAMVVGNHEFDFGQDILRKRVQEARFPVLGANVKGMEDVLTPCILKEIDGVRIAIAGVVTDETPVTTHPRNVAGLQFASPSGAVRQCQKKFKKRADIFLVLSHMGFSEDRAFAQEVKGIDVIVGGHSHTKLLNPEVVGTTIIVQAWEHAKALGVLDLTIRDGKIVRFDGHLEEIKPGQGTEDKTVAGIVKKYEHRADLILNETIGETDVSLDGENVRTRETNFGDFIADVMRQVSGSDTAIVNGGDIRISIRKGAIKAKDIYAALPFNDYIIAVKLTGEQIREALEHGVSAIEKGSGRFPQVSGISFSYDPFAAEGSRVREIIVGGRPVAPDKEYTVAINDFLAAGGDGYRVFGDAIGPSKEFSKTEGIMKGGKVAYSDPGRWLKDLVIETIRERKTIAPKVEGRIREIR
jgi:2',3'-cyclic-nucleotide 2'-phosphodiesterase (5'-nucleotidase family)